MSRARNGFTTLAQLKRLSAEAWKDVVDEEDDDSWSVNGLNGHLKFLLGYLIHEDKLKG